MVFKQINKKILQPRKNAFTTDNIFTGGDNFKIVEDVPRKHHPGGGDTTSIYQRKKKHIGGFFPLPPAAIILRATTPSAHKSITLHSSTPNGDSFLRRSVKKNK
jgi:hypothetical protein